MIAWWDVIRRANLRLITRSRSLRSKASLSRRHPGITREWLEDVQHLPINGCFFNEKYKYNSLRIRTEDRPHTFSSNLHPGSKQLMFGEMLLLDFSLALQLLHKGHCIRLAAYFTVKTFLKWTVTWPGTWCLTLLPNTARSDYTIDPIFCWTVL